MRKRKRNWYMMFELGFPSLDRKFYWDSFSVSGCSIKASWMKEKRQMNMKAISRGGICIS